MDNITALTPGMVDAGPGPRPLAELPPNEQTIEPLDVLEDEPVRSKLRLYAILVSLYVYCLALS
jgi:hypothetical protein